ncbi:hypothetical protein LTR53_001945 [Teratosphaeriaceae sp. CCFEE 6253]|nr:hypothetical protein LTR53_001945 [Teratosphaeriaceae sp. CCFEE 6253]
MSRNFDAAAAERGSGDTIANAPSVPMDKYAGSRRRGENHGFTRALSDADTRRLNAVGGLPPGTPGYNNQWLSMTALNYFNVDQLVMMLQFMQHVGFTDGEYATGIITAGSRGGPANVNIHGTYDLQVPLVFNHDDDAESRGNMGH